MLLADAAWPLLASGVLIGDDCLYSEYRIEPLDFEPPDEDAWRRRMRELDREIERIGDDRPKGGSGWPCAGREYYADQITRARRGQYAANMDVAVQPMRIGPVEIVAFSGEVFYELGQQLREQSARPDLWVAAYCNGGEGYIPTRGLRRGWLRSGKLPLVLRPPAPHPRRRRTPRGHGGPSIPRRRAQSLNQAERNDDRTTIR